jgi:hypothetical protein
MGAFNTGFDTFNLHRPIMEVTIGLLKAAMEAAALNS